jgi:hypothetical protein
MRATAKNRNFRQETGDISMRCISVVLLGLTLAVPALGQEVVVSANDTTQTVITAQKGKRVTLRTRSGQELTGTVREVTGRLIVLGAVTGREFFDAVVPLEAVEAVLIRTKQ